MLINTFVHTRGRTHAQVYLNAEPLENRSNCYLFADLTLPFTDLAPCMTYVKQKMNHNNNNSSSNNNTTIAKMTTVEVVEPREPSSMME